MSLNKVVHFSPFKNDMRLKLVPIYTKYGSVRRTETMLDISKTEQFNTGN